MAPSEPQVSALAWAKMIESATGKTVRVTYTRATRRVLSCVTRPDGSHDVRLSRIFEGAPPETQADLCAWMRSGKRARKACARLDAWIDEAVRELPPSRQTRLRSEGTEHDLSLPFAELLSSEFASDEPLDGKPWPQITWGRRSPRARYSLRLGSYEPTANLIRVHPVLDQPAVPASFVRYIVFHELLHAVVPSEKSSSGRSMHHPAAFRERERRYSGYTEAVAWQDEQLPALLRSARTGRPMRTLRGPRNRTAPRDKDEAARGNFFQRLLF